MDRLKLAKCLLDSATQAVHLKQLLLKDQLRNAVVKAVHLKQYAETESELTDAMEGLIKRQFADAGRKLGRTKDETELIEKHLPGQHDQSTHGYGGSGWGEGSDPMAAQVATQFNTIRDSYGYPEIPSGWTAKTGAKSPNEGTEDSLCYSNALKLAQEEGLSLHVGFYFDTKVSKRLADGGDEYINFSSHAWNEKDGNIYDSTYGKNKGTYVGVKIDPQNLKNGSDVRDVLFGLIGMDKSPSHLTTKSFQTNSIFDPRDWDSNLVNTALPILMKKAGEAAAAQMLLMGLDIAPKGKRTKGDLPGHPFRGNQWSGGAGGGDKFRVNGTLKDDLPKETTRLTDDRTPDLAVVEISLDRLFPGKTIPQLQRMIDDPDNEWDKDAIDKYRQAYLEGGEDSWPELPLLGMRNGVLMLDDGNHRVIGAMLAGATKIKVNAPERWTDPQKSPSHLITKSFQTKASRATEWLLDLDDADIDTMALWPEVFTLPSGLTVDMGFATEWPDWMKAEISQQMKECFEQPFWAGINDTTANGIQSHVLKGIEEGLSIREIREQMVGDGLDEYYHNRGINIARTESGNALNGARSAAMDRLAEEVPGLKTKKTWMSVLGTTTRDTHAHLDGVPADRDGLWYLGGVRIPWPGHWNLPVRERACCQCSIVQSWGMGDDAASELIEEYNQRLNEERRLRNLWMKGDLPGHPFRGNQHSGGGGLQANIAEMISHLETIFKGPGRAAAVNEVLTASKFPEYLKGILAETPGVDEIRAVVDWSVRRGRIWEVA